MEYPFIIGTAGHIDHGKTSLVKAMTGVDCDRLEEEKRRGITIELGFAPLNLASGKTVSIIDVPGHERFIRQMAAGAAGIDTAMLIIAANEGVMPQTREHLDILNLLGVKCGLVVLTKKDLVDEETLEIARAEVAELINGSCLSDAAIIPVSAHNGEGIPEVLEQIENILDRIPVRKDFGAFFLPVDRVFGKKGFGSVITGTLYRGSVSEGDEVELMPSGITSKVRFLQAHGEKAVSVRAGQRAAINLSSIPQDSIRRGDVVCAKGVFIPTDCMSAWVTMLPTAAEGLKHRQRVRLHIGTEDVAARVSLLRLGKEERDSGYLPGTSGPVQILPESKITVIAGQHFVIRFYSPLITIGGGQIMLPNATLATGSSDRAGKAEMVKNLADDLNPATLLTAIIYDRGILSINELLELSQMEKNDFNECLVSLHELIEFGKARIFISKAAFDKVAGAVLWLLKKFHKENPELAGQDVEKLYTALEAVNGTGKVNIGDFKELMGLMSTKKIIAPATVQGRTCYSAPGFTNSLDNKLTAQVDSAREALNAAGFSLLTEGELQEKTKLSSQDIKRVAAFLREKDDLRMIKDGLLFPLKTRNELLAILGTMQEDITVGSLRDKIGVSRKYTLPMLEFFDSQGLTRRDGDKRTLVSP
ncbi:MAG: selenocysteine-specific translation elongation factor [Treponema sp.]|nr:selenocysteine-specific translation elongation factor [Treponema sp.]